MLTFLRFLIGRRDAILKLGADRRTIGIGLLFVFAAALARDYDGADLLAEPYWLVVPLLASLVMSAILFVPLDLRVRASKHGQTDASAGSPFRFFLGLFWMTAPLAFFYAIPYERLLSPAGAMRANLLTLAAVAAWRVLLISRVLSVLTGRSFKAMFGHVMLFADIAVIVALFATPIPIIDIMGGIRLTPAETVLQNTAVLIGVAAFVSLPVWLVVGIGVLARKTRWEIPPNVDVPRSGHGLTFAAVGSIVLLLAVSVGPQGEQRLRHSVEADMKAGRISEALATLSAHQPADFPPHWDPPPRPAYREPGPQLLVVAEVLADHGGADWVCAAFLEKLELQYLHRHAMYRILDLGGIPLLDRIERVLERIPGGVAVRDRNADALSNLRLELEIGASGATQPSTAPSTRPASQEVTLPAAHGQPS